MRGTPQTVMCTEVETDGTVSLCVTYGNLFHVSVIYTLPWPCDSFAARAISLNVGFHDDLAGYTFTLDNRTRARLCLAARRSCSRLKSFMTSTIWSFNYFVLTPRRGIIYHDNSIKTASTYTENAEYHGKINK